MWENFIPFLAASLAIELTPGPNMAYLALLSAQHGRMAGLAAVAGVALGLLTIGGLAAVGFATLVQETPALYQTMRWAGVAYLLYLAWDTWRESRMEGPPAAAAATRFTAFRRGLVTNLLNPKAFLFYVAVLPGFVSSESRYGAEATVLTLAYVGVATLVHLVVVAGAGGLTGLLGRRQWRTAAGAVFAALLVGVAVWVALHS